MSCARNGAGEATLVRFDLRGNGVGDQLDPRWGEAQIDASAEIVLVVCRDARWMGVWGSGVGGTGGGGDRFKIDRLTVGEAASWSFGKQAIVAPHLICTSGPRGRLKAGGDDALQLYSINLNAKCIEVIAQQFIFSRCISQHS